MPNPGGAPPCAPTARATADECLRLRRLDDVRALVAAVVRTGVCSVDDIASEYADGPRNRSMLLRLALEDVGAGAASAPEGRAARILRGAGIRGFEQNARIDLPGARHVVADFYWPELRAVLEIDSAEFHLAPARWRATMDRHLALATAGYSVIHRPPSALRTPQRFAADVRAWLVRRAAEVA